MTAQTSSPPPSPVPRASGRTANSNAPTESYWAGRTNRSELESVAATLRRDTWSSWPPPASTRCRQHLLLLRPDARHRRAARRAAGARGGHRRRPGPLLRRRPRQRRRRAAGDDQVVRHQLPLPGSRDRPVHRVLAQPRQGARRTGRSSRTGHSGPAGDHRTGHLPAAQQGRRRRGRPDRAARRAGAALRRLLELLSRRGAEWVQFDEPALVTDISANAAALAEGIYDALGALANASGDLRRHLLR